MVKTYEVELVSSSRNGEIEVRPVTVPVGELERTSSELEMLEVVFKYGQNEFQPLPFCSVSVGDVIRFHGERWRVASFGFEPAREGGLF